MLPDLDGFEVSRKLREAGRWSPVLMLTARDAVADRVAGLDAGADDYLTKPFSYVVLVARVKALLRRRGRGRAPRPCYVVGDLEGRHRRAGASSRADDEIDLTAKEFAVLEQLDASPGRGR